MNLFLPSGPQPVHFVGICGAGMSALAMVALRRGVSVQGSDLDTSTSGDLKKSGARVFQGHDPNYLAGARAVVVTAAVSDDHPEIVAARKLGIPVFSRKMALALLLEGGRTLAVAGTHGKTTSTAMATQMLAACGMDPTGLAGGRVAEWGGNARIGSPDLFVVEADEYDRAFLTLSPEVAVVTNLEPDHLECYGTEESLEAAFLTFASRARYRLVGTGGDRMARLARRLGHDVTRFGVEEGELQARVTKVRPHSTSAMVTLPDKTAFPMEVGVPGEHNLRNALGALGGVVALGADPMTAAQALRDFHGVGRRFERLGEVGGVVIVDDYAHHPSEIAATIAAARQAYPRRRLVALFQPHLYSRTRDMAPAMGAALARADQVLVTEIYPAREAPIPGVSGRQVAAAATDCGASAIFLADQRELIGNLGKLLRPGDLLLVMGAGDITKIAHQMAEGGG